MAVLTNHNAAAIVCLSLGGCWRDPAPAPVTTPPPATNASVTKTRRAVEWYAGCSEPGSKGRLTESESWEANNPASKNEPRLRPLLDRIFGPMGANFSVECRDLVCKLTVDRDQAEWMVPLQHEWHTTCPGICAMEFSFGGTFVRLAPSKYRACFASPADVPAASN